jgi:hypothetical protein
MSCGTWGFDGEMAHLEDLSVDVSIVLNYILNIYNGIVWTIRMSASE